MSSDFSGLEADPHPSVSGTCVVAGLVAVGGAFVVGLVMAGFSGFTATFGPGHLICPDGGDEIWHRPATSVLRAEIIAGLVLTLVVWLFVAFALSSRGVTKPLRYGALLAMLSAGSVAFWIVLSD